jgi:hypothetical protein
MTCGYFNKIAIKINLPKNKKYENKVNPIYYIKSDYFEPNKLYINKYELKYIENLILFYIFVCLIPYPILFFNFKYSYVGNVHFCSKKDITNWGHTNIGEYYEKKKERINNTEQEKKIVDLQIANQINNFNKVFNENYE